MEFGEKERMKEKDGRKKKAWEGGYVCDISAMASSRPSSYYSDDKKN
jgi:hypothetical protein